MSYLQYLRILSLHTQLANPYPRFWRLFPLYEYQLRDYYGDLCLTTGQRPILQHIHVIILRQLLTYDYLSRERDKQRQCFPHNNRVTMDEPRAIV